MNSRGVLNQVSDPNWIWCGPDDPPRERKSGVKLIELRIARERGFVHLVLENISKKLVREIPSLLVDMLEIGSYVYAADQATRRGGETLPHEGRDWRRELRFDIPVRNPDVWKSAEVIDALKGTLSFLSDDYYEFHFRKLIKEPPPKLYFDYDEGNPWFEADEVMLFSGGLDSLTGLCQATVKDNRRVVLVSHWAAPQIAKRQRMLVSDFRRVTDGRHKVLHIPVRVNKGEKDTRDTNQRSRSFLYVMLAGAIAELHHLDQVSFYENGIVSFNLPISGQILGARASRSTHPRSMTGFGELLSLLLQKDFKVVNPFFWKTRADVGAILNELGVIELMKSTNSCAHVRTGDPIDTHCGVCSQCIDRRFAALHCGAGENDPADSYKVLLPLDPVQGTENRTMVESYLRFAREMTKINIDEFYAKYGQAFDILPHLDMPTSKGAEALYDFHRRHGNQVCSVLQEQVKEQAGAITKGTIDPSSMLAMVTSLPKARLTVDSPVKQFPALPNLSWDKIEIELVSIDSVRIRFGSFCETYTGYDIGFRDGRKKNALNQQWNLLCYLATTGGVVDKTVSYEKKALYKTFHALRQTLKVFFGLDSMPISEYDKKDGWVTHFKITDRSGGRL